MKKSATQSAFFNLRVLIGLTVVCVGVFLALAGFGSFSALAQGKKKPTIITHSDDPLVPNGFDCSRIKEMGIDVQENFRAQAIMIACGEMEGGSPTSSFGKFVASVKKLFAPLVFGAADVNLITGTETPNNITQSETFSLAHPDDPNQILVAYNDSRGRNATPINISGASFSTDGGATFTRLTAPGGQGPFVATLGDPVVMFHRPTSTWVTVWLDTACGSQGLGGYKTTTPAVVASWTHFCLHTATNDDRESGWADTNPASPFYGNLYVSWGSGANIVASRSTDGGTTWSAPVTVGVGRNVQITGDMSGNGNIYIAGMNENGGNANFNRNNHIYRSTNGGVSWTTTYIGPTFQGPGVGNSGYFACMFNNPSLYWRHEGWGQPAVYNNVVHLVYASRVGAPPADAGDVYYIRSTDSGATFSAPFKLNTDATTRPQWQPNLSVSPTGTVFATWYDARDSASTDCVLGNPASPCYKMYSRKSNDNGVSWMPDDALSDVLTPLPAQPDTGIQATYAGDYDYGSAVATKHVTAWTDGRNAISGASQQDAYTDREQVGFAVTGVTPACGSIVAVQPSDFAVNLTDAVMPASVQGSDFTVNGIPADSFVLSNGDTTITFHFNSSPVTTQGLQTMQMAAGAINRVSDGQGNLAFTCTFRYDALTLQVTTTNPPVGGNFTGPGSSTYDVNFNEAVDPASVQTTDLTLSGVTGSSVTAVSVINGNTTAQFTLNFTSIFSGTLTASIAAGVISDPFGNPNAAFSGNYNYTGNFCPTFTQNFDGVTPPLLPAGWTATNIVNSDGILWQTSNSGSPAPPADSLPNAAWINDPAARNDKVLVTPTLTYSSGAQLTFRNNYDLEPSGTTAAFDAGLLEFSANDGASWNDIVLAGGSFSQGGYNRQTIATGFQNPCFQQYGTNKPSWSGSSAGFVNTTVSLPASGVGQQVKLRWRMCSDTTVSRTGWRVDSVAIYEPCPAAVTSAVSRKAHGAGGNFDVDLPTTGTPGIECRSGGATDDYTMVVTFGNNVTVSGSPQAEVTLGTATIGTGGVSNGGAVTVAGNVVTIPLTNVANAQTINVRLNGVNTTSAGDTPAVDITIPMSRLLGDTNANGAVNSSDVSQTKGRIGQPVDSSNFRSDINESNSINSTDASQVKSNVGNGLP